MENIEKSAAQWQELVSEKDKEINKKDREIADLRKQVDWFKGQFKLLQSKQFGPSSEKSVELEEQLSLFNEPELFADPKAVEPDLEQIVYKRKCSLESGIWISPSCPQSRSSMNCRRRSRSARYAAVRCMLAGMMWFGGNFGMSRRSIKWWNTSRQPIVAGIAKRTR